MQVTMIMVSLYLLKSKQFCRGLVIKALGAKYYYLILLWICTRTRTWLGLSVYAAFTVSPGSTFSCACYLITVTGEYLVRLLATCIVEDESSGSQRICIIHIPRARFPEQWNQCGQVFASFDVLIPGGKKDADMCQCVGSVWYTSKI